MKSKKKTAEPTYVERDISWMYFNHRILQEAQKDSVPVLEKMSFLGIYSNNLDEFSRVRVASLTRLAESKHVGDAARKVLKKTIKTVNKLNEQYSREYTATTQQVFRQLEDHHIRLVDEQQLNDRQKQYLAQLHEEPPAAPLRQ